MKKYLALLLIFIVCSTYIFYNNYSFDSKSKKDGDPGIHDPLIYTLGGTIEKANNDILSIGKLQTSYIMYLNKDISYEQMIEENMTNLEKVLNYPFNAQKGYLFSVGYDPNSKIQFYYQSNQEETRTTILKVEHDKSKNKVTKIYDGSYFKLVSVDTENVDQLVAYDYNDDKFIIGVN